MQKVYKSQVSQLGDFYKRNTLVEPEFKSRNRPILALQELPRAPS